MIGDAEPRLEDRDQLHYVNAVRYFEKESVVESQLRAELDLESEICAGDFRAASLLVGRSLPGAACRSEGLRIGWISSCQGNRSECSCLVGSETLDFVRVLTCQQFNTGKVQSRLFSQVFQNNSCQMVSYFRGSRGLFKATHKIRSSDSKDRERQQCLFFIFKVWCDTFSMDHDCEYWEDPWTFNPERFLDDEGQLVAPDHINRKRYDAKMSGNDFFPKIKVSLNVGTVIPFRIQICASENAILHKEYMEYVEFCRGFGWWTPVPCTRS